MRLPRLPRPPHQQPSSPAWQAEDTLDHDGATGTMSSRFESELYQTGLLDDDGDDGATESVSEELLED